MGRTRDVIIYGLGKSELDDTPTSYAGDEFEGARQQALADLE